MNENCDISEPSTRTKYTYDPGSNLKTAAYPNYPSSDSSTFTYDTLNRLTGLSTPVSSYSYQLGAAGNRKSVTEGTGRAVNWTYDNIYRLTQESVTNDPANKDGIVGYSLDPVGNREQMTSSLSGITPGSWTYNTDDEFLTGEADSYDNNGNTTRSGANSYVFDSENHLKSMNGVVTMVYDGDGNRVAKTVNSVTTRYLVDDLNPTGEAQVVDELVGGVVTRQYTYGLERISENQFVNNAWTPGFYGYDGSGSVRQLTNYATGQITDTDDYDAFGNKVNSTGTTPNNYLYRGEQYDSDLGLYYLRARYYNPATGRFLNVDSLAGQGQRRYQYAAADPVNGMDPSGNADLVEYHPLCCAKAVPFPTFNFPPWCQAGPDISISSALPPCPVPPPPTCRPPKTLFAQSVDPGADYFSVKIDWLLSSKSCKGGVVVQHVVGDWPKADNNLAGHWNYWEAWQISKDNTQTAYHKRFGFDDRFGGFFGTKLHAEARFYEGTPLPNTFVAGSVKPAHDLPATLTDPHLSTANATPPVVRDFNR